MKRTRIDRAIQWFWRPPREAFTLMELLAVVAILSLFAAAVAVNYRMPLLNARFQNACERIEGIDRQLRLAASNHGRPTELRIDMKDGILAWEQEIASGTSSESYAIPAGIRLDQVYVGQNPIEGYETKIRFSSMGTTATYALGLNLPDGRRQWLLFVGATGQIVQLDNDEKLKQFLSFK